MKTVLITGANSGIGMATAIELARRGWHVIAGMRALQRGEALLQQAAGEGLSIECVVLDVTDAASCEAAVDQVLARHGQLDVLVNNAGVGLVSPVEEADLDGVRAGFETNFFGPMRLAQLVAPGMRERGEGCIVNVSSVAGRFVNPGQGFYTASKMALEGATETLALELRRFNVRVVLIEPGVTRTAALEKKPDLRPDTAHLPILMRAGRALASRVALAVEASTVAQSIHQAIVSPEYRLRHALGEDTRLWLAGRARLSDEQWVDYARDMSDDEVRDFWKVDLEMAV